jgi:branched-subunit amino acid ABC-type transport system permease component
VIDYLRFLILGLGSGAIIAAVALGLTLTYRASGVINFAQGAMASWVAYTYYSLRTEGSIPLFPMPWLTTKLQLGGPMSVMPAITCSLLVAIILGYLSYYLVFRPLRTAPALAKIVASVGMMLMIQSAIVLNYGGGQRSLPAILPINTISFAGVTIGQDRLILVGLVLAVTLLLWALYRHTEFGRKTRAAAESERLAVLLGISVDRQASVNWVLGSVLAGLIGIFVSPVTGLTPSGLTLIVIPSLAAALLARFSSFWIATFAGLAIGMGQSALMLVQLRVSWWPDVGLDKAIPFLIIVGAILLLGRSLPGRGQVEARSLPEAFAPQLTVLRLANYGCMFLFAVVATVWMPYEYRAALNNTYIGVTLALSLVVITGFAGQLGLAQMTLAGFAAFALSTFQTRFGLPMPASIALAVMSSACIGVIFALPALRTRGSSLAIVTLAGGMAIQQTFFTRDGWFGAVTSKSVSAPQLFGFEFGPQSVSRIGDGMIPDPMFGLVLLGLCTVCCIGVMRLRRSHLGAAMLAVRANERASAAAGVNVAAVKIAAFGVGGVLAGLGGVAFAYNLSSYTAKSFDIFTSLGLLALTYLGGISTVGGAIWAGLMYTQGLTVVLMDNLFEIGRYEGYIAGLSLIITAVMYGEGIDGANRAFFRSVRKLCRRFRAESGSFSETEKAR